MNGRRVSSAWVDRVWFVVFFVLSSASALTAAQHLGATFDEPLYVRAAMHFWHTGSLEELLKMGTMPLPPVVCLCPVFLWEQIRGTPFTTWDDFHQFLPVARAMTLLFWGLLLLMTGRVARSIGGPWAGRLAVAGVACEPNLLAHASLATTDIALAAFLLTFVYVFQRGRDRSWRSRVGWPAVAYAFAMLAKASTLAFAPLCMLMIELARQRRRSRDEHRRFFAGGWVRRFVVDSLQIGFLGLGLVFLMCGSDWQTQPSFVAWAHGLPDGLARDLMGWLSDHLAIFPNAGVGLAYQIKHNMKGHSCFILGEDYARAVWFYFPAVLAIKLTIPLLAGLAAVLVLRPRALFNWAGLCALVLLLFSLNCRVQIGIRLIFPAVVFAIIALSAVVANPPAPLRRWVAILAAVGIGSMACASARVWPHGLTYVNPAWGGPEHGYRVVSDSNYDWAQGLPELKAWKDANGVSNLKVWYFGLDPEIFAIAGGNCPVHEWGLNSVDDFRERVRGHFFAVCLTNLYGSYTRRPDLEIAVGYLRSLKPVTRTTTFFIYDFTSDAGPPPAE